MAMRRSLGLVLIAAFILVNAPAAADTCTPPPRGMIGWWPGDRNAQDIQSGNDGTLRPGVGYAAGLVGDAFSIDGRLGTGVIIPGSAALNAPDQLTLDAWVNPSGYTNPFPGVIWKNQPNTFPQYLMALDRDSGAHCNIGSLVTIVGGHVPLNTWSHVACTYDRQVLRSM
jgi:hypothetical protein